jgi:NhaA family Na+:H+ antiporter
MNKEDPPTREESPERIIKDRGSKKVACLVSEQRYNAPLERAFYHVRTPFEELLRHQTTSGIALIAATIAAIVLTNSPLAEWYASIINTDISLAVGGWSLKEPIRLWINDGLMGIFFFAVGLEIKRELLVGELSSFKKAALPFIGAVGGMIVPAIIYYLFNPTAPALNGWAIPTATDIAFVIGVLSLLGPRVPQSMYVFLISLAIVDDLGAVLIIAVYYTQTISTPYVLNALAVLSILVLFNLVGVRRTLPYLLGGGLLWFMMLKSGIHATLAGVMVAAIIPSRSKMHPRLFTQRIGELLGRYKREHNDGGTIKEDDEQFALIQVIRGATGLMETPMHRILDDIRLPVAFLIMPVFAFANAGVVLDFDLMVQAIHSPVTLGIAFGLVFGKGMGVVSICALAIWLNIARLPDGMDWHHLLATGLLAGIGFTMSMFIAALGFRGMPEYLHLAKTGILASSLIAGLLGYLFLRFTVPIKRNMGLVNE